MAKAPSPVAAWMGTILQLPLIIILRLPSPLPSLHMVLISIRSYSGLRGILSIQVMHFTIHSTITN